MQYRAHLVNLKGKPVTVKVNANTLNLASQKVLRWVYSKYPNETWCIYALESL